ncbi:Cytochrome P450 [Cordyceps militaris]|uniref:Cytochrome P450 n=1 Tax=Cordyceps militaris TaxID=73501 RepID=A0A2H4SPB0_CORMI|nr:Cytochrome P450 [Cordyceps militaris]
MPVRKDVGDCKRKTKKGAAGRSSCELQPSLRSPSPALDESNTTSKSASKEDRQKRGPMRLRQRQRPRSTSTWQHLRTCPTCHCIDLQHNVYAVRGKGLRFRRLEGFPSLLKRQNTTETAARQRDSMSSSDAGRSLHM